jgi:hypothetical protein
MLGNPIYSWNELGRIQSKEFWTGSEFPSVFHSHLEVPPEFQDANFLSAGHPGGFKASLK